MTRTCALMATIVLSHALATSTHAQSTEYGDGGFNPTAQGLWNYGNVPSGAFGIEYAQPLVAGTLVVDQYGLVHVTPTVESSMPQTAAAQPAPTGRSTNRASGSRSSGTKAKPRYQLPRATLGWDGASGVVLYSPGTRHESYGSGYARGPYGVVDYGYMYRGWPLGY